MLVDSHCHLDFPVLNQDLSGVLARARAAGVGSFLTIGTKLAESEAVIAIADAHDDVHCTIGVHPHEAEREAQTVTVDRLVALASHKKVVGIGESGLDFFYDEAPRELQANAFNMHIQAAIETGLPLVVHTREADDLTQDILRRHAKGGRLTGVLHCFTSGRDLAMAALDLGFYISFSGIVTFKNASDLREIARLVPDDRILVETDSPYLAPVPMRGKSNEPAYVAHTAHLLADIRGCDRAVSASKTTENYFRLFNRAAPPVGGKA